MEDLKPCQECNLIYEDNEPAVSLLKVKINILGIRKWAVICNNLECIRFWNPEYKSFFKRKVIKRWNTLEKAND